MANITQKNTHELFSIPLSIREYGNITSGDNINIQNLNDVWINSNQLITMSQASQDKMPLENLAFHVKIILTILLVASLCIGSYFKCVMYRFVFSTNKKNRGWMHRPINVLTVTSAIIHHITHTWAGISYVVRLNMKTPIADVLGAHYCLITYVVGMYGLAYLCVGSLGVAVYRVLYIRHEYWVKNIIGEKRLLAIVLALSIITTVIVVFLFSLEGTDHRVSLNNCNGLSPAFHQILIDYNSSRGIQTLSTTQLQKIVLICLIAFQTIEFSIYVWFFYYRYQNDNGKIQNFLMQGVVRERNIKNVSTFVGHFYGFIVEFVFLIIILVCVHFANEDTLYLRSLSNIVKFSDFGLLSVVEVLSSPGLKNFMR